MSIALCIVTLVLSAVIVVLLRRQARMAEQKRHSDSRYRTVIDQAADGIFLVGAETGSVMEANPSLRRRLGYAADEIVKLKARTFRSKCPRAWILKHSLV